MKASKFLDNISIYKHCWDKSLETNCLIIALIFYIEDFSLKISIE